MRMRASGTSSGITALVVLAAYYGITGVLARYLSVGNGLFEQWYLRYAIALIVALLVFHKQVDLKKFLHLPKKEWIALAVRVISGGVIAVSLYTLAVQQAKIGPVAFMQGVPVITILAVVIFHEKLTVQKGLVVLLSFLGVAIVAIGNVHDLLSFNLGEVYSLISGAFFALMFVTRRWHTGTLNNQEITVAMISCSFVINYVLSLVLYHRIFPSPAHWSPTFIVILLVAGFSSVVSIFLQNYGFEHVDGVIAGSILNLEQVFGPIFGFMFYHEKLNLHEFAGGLIILLAALAMNQLSRKQTPAIAIPD